jgi:segregation and condensation protein B
VALVEAVLLTSRNPVTANDLVDAASAEGVSAADVQEAIERIREGCDRPDRGIRLEGVAGGWRLVTPPELDPYLQAFHGAVRRQRLSQAALEVLAIVAHRQPVTLPEINFIRGASSTGVVRTLLERKLIRLAGRKAVVGKPFLYRTTREFLVHFGLERPEDLPDPEDLVPADGVDGDPASMPFTAQGSAGDADIAAGSAGGNGSLAPCAGFGAASDLEEPR